MSSQTPLSPHAPQKTVELVEYERLDEIRPRPWCLEQDVFDAIIAQFEELPLDLWNAMRYRVEKWTSEQLSQRKRPTPQVPDHLSDIPFPATLGVPVFEDVDPPLLAKLFAACIERDKHSE